jgi:hypothetical protein
MELEIKIFCCELNYDVDKQKFYREALTSIKNLLRGDSK